MNWIDFFVGFLLMNAMPHFILGVWKGKMLSGFGTGNARNIGWALCNFAASHGLFIYAYGFQGYPKHELYLGANVVLLTFFFTAPFWYRHFHKK